MQKITDLDEVEEIVKRVQYGRGPYINYWEFYRGQGSIRYKLHPGLFRNKLSEKGYLNEEKRVFNKFIKAVSKNKIIIQENFQKEKYPHSQTWFSLFQAQHLGLKTRLLDWTIKWQMALLFAVENNNLHNEDGQFWVLKCPPEKLLTDASSKILDKSPFSIDNFHLINYPFFHEEENDHFTAEHRRARQWGRFSIQPINEAIIPLEDQNDKIQYFEKYIVDKDSKKKIKDKLENEGFTLDWAYYRNENNVSTIIKNINNPSFFYRLFCS